MTTPVDIGSLMKAMNAGRLTEGTLVFLSDTTIGDPSSVTRVQSTLRELPPAARGALVIGSTVGERADIAGWRKLAESFGVQKDAAFQRGTELDPIVVGVDARGLETAGIPERIRVLPRAQAAARETLKSAARLAVDPSLSRFERIRSLLNEASRLRDGLGVRPTFDDTGTPSTVAASYQMALGLALAGVPTVADPGARVGVPTIPDGDLAGAGRSQVLDLDLLTRSVLPSTVAEVMNAFAPAAAGERPASFAPSGTSAAKALHDGLKAVPGSFAMVRTGGLGLKEDRLRWLVSLDQGVYWVNPELDNEPVARFDPKAENDARLRELRAPGTTVTVLDPDGVPTTLRDLAPAATPKPAAPVATPPATALVDALALTGAEPVFVFSTAVGTGRVADPDGVALPSIVLESLVDGLRRQYPNGRVLLIGPDPGNGLRDRAPELFALPDRAAAHGLDLTVNTQLDDVLIALNTGRQATVIGMSSDVGAVSERLGTRTVRLGAGPDFDGTRHTEAAQLQRLDVPIDWPEHLARVERAANADDPAALTEALNDWIESAEAYAGRLSMDPWYPAEAGSLADATLSEGAYRDNGFTLQGLDTRVNRFRANFAEWLSGQMLPAGRNLDAGRTREWFAEFSRELQLDDILRVFSTDVDELARRAVDLDREYGTAVWPKKVKYEERDVYGLTEAPKLMPGTPELEDDGPVRSPSGNPVFKPVPGTVAADAAEAAGPAPAPVRDAKGKWQQPAAQPWESAVVEAKGAVPFALVRRPAAWMALSDLRIDMLEDRPGAEWHYFTDADGRIWIASEVPVHKDLPAAMRARDAAAEAVRTATPEQAAARAAELRDAVAAIAELERSSVVGADQLTALFEAWAEQFPGLTLEHVVETLNTVGHPAISGAEHIVPGTGAIASLLHATRGRTSGELRLITTVGGMLDINTKSGRFMSLKVRTPGPGDAMRWADNAARRISAQVDLPARIGEMKYAAEGKAEHNPMTEAPRPVAELPGGTLRPDGLGGFRIGNDISLLVRQTSVSGRPVLMLLPTGEFQRMQGINWLPHGDGARDRLPVVTVQQQDGYVRVPATQDGVEGSVLLRPDELARITSRLGPDQAVVSWQADGVPTAEFLRDYAAAIGGTAVALPVTGLSAFLPDLPKIMVTAPEAARVVTPPQIVVTGDDGNLIPEPRGALRAGMDHGAAYHAALGRDFFRVREQAPAPDFARSPSAVRTSQVDAYFQRLDLTTRTGPVTLDGLPENGTVLRNSAGQEMPLHVPMVWAGSAISPDNATAAAFMAGAAQQARALATEGYFTTLWVTETPTEAGLAWARDNGIRVISVRDVYHESNPLDAEFLAQLGGHTVDAFSAAVDVLLWRIIEDFGGFYTDGDNAVEDAAAFAAEVRTLFEAHGWAVHEGPSTPETGRAFNVSGVLGARNHPAIREVRNLVSENYASTQPELMAPIWELFQGYAGALDLTDHPAMDMRRKLAMWLGPQILEQIGARLDPRHLAADGELPGLRSVTMGQAGSWYRADPLEPVRSFGDTERAAVLPGLAATLVWHLRFRQGDLYLPAVAPVVAGFADPAAVWRELLEPFLTEPELRGRVRTVTDTVMVGDAEHGPQVRTVPLPADLRDALGLTADPAPEWRLGEAIRPVRLADNPVLDWTPAERPVPGRLASALIDAPLGRSEAGMLPTRPRPRMAPPATNTTGLLPDPVPAVDALVAAAQTRLDADDLTTQLDAIDDLVTRLNTLRDQYDADWTAQRTAVNGLEAQIAALPARQAAVTGEIDNRQNEVVTRNTRIDQLDGLLDTVATALARIDQRSRDAQGVADAARAAFRAADATADPEALRDAIERADDAVRGIDVERRQRQREFADLEGQRGTAQDRVEALYQEITDLIRDRQAIADELPGLRNRLTAARAAAQTAVGRRAAIQTQVDHYRQQAAEWAGFALDDLQVRTDRLAEAADDGSPQVAEAAAARAELDAIIGRGAAVTAADVGRLAYLRHLADEVAKLQAPGVQLVDEDAVENDVRRMVTASGRTVPADRIDELASREADVITMRRVHDTFTGAAGDAGTARDDAVRQYQALIDAVTAADTAHRAALADATAAARVPALATDLAAKQAARDAFVSRLVAPQATVTGDWWSDPAAEGGREKLRDTAQNETGVRAITEHVRTPNPSWFVSERRVLGDGFVKKVNPLSDAQKASLRASVRSTAPRAEVHAGELLTWLDTLIRDRDPHQANNDWQRLMQVGAGRMIGDHFVRVYAKPGAMEYRKPDPKADPEVDHQKSKYGDTTAGRAWGGTKGWNVVGPLSFLWHVANETMDHILGPILRVSADGELQWQEAVTVEKQSGNRALLNDVHDFAADTALVIEVDGEQILAHDLPKHLLLALPQKLSSVDDSHSTSVGAPDSVTNPQALEAEDYVVNAADFDELLTQLQSRLRSPDFGMTKAGAARAVHELREEMFNEKTGKDRNQWWSTGSWVSPFFKVPFSKRGGVTLPLGRLGLKDLTIPSPVKRRDHLEGHVTVESALTELRRVTVADQVIIRNDIAATVTRGVSRGIGSGAGFRAGVEFPVHAGHHILMPRWDAIKMRWHRSVKRSVGTQAQAKTATMRKDDLVRYRATVNLQLRLHTNKGTIDVDAPITTEFGLPKQRAAIFEANAMSDPVLRERFRMPEGPTQRSRLNPKRWAAAVRNPHSRVGAAIRPTPSMPQPFRKKGMRHFNELLAAARKGPIEVTVDGHAGLPATLASLNAANVVVRAHGDFTPGPGNAQFRYLLDAGGAVLGAWELAPVPVPRTDDGNAPVLDPAGQPVMVRPPARFVANPAYQPVARPAGPEAPFPEKGLHGAAALYLKSIGETIEIHIQGDKLPQGYGLMFRPRYPSETGGAAYRQRDRSIVRFADDDLTYAPGQRTDATFRYLVDPQGVVLGAHRLGPVRTAADGTVTRPVVGDLILNPLAFQPLTPRTDPPRATVRANDFLAADRGGYVQVQLSPGVPEALRNLFRDAPHVELLRMDGHRVPGQTLGPGVPARTAAGAIAAPPAGTQRFVLHADGRMSAPLIPLTAPTREPLALVNRAGLGQGSVKEMPGADQIVQLVADVLEHQMRQVGLLPKGATAQQLAREIALKFGTPGLRGSQRTLYDGGVSNEIKFGGYTFQVNIGGILDELREVSTEQDITMDVQGKGQAGYTVHEHHSTEFGTGLDGTARVKIANFFGARIKFIEIGYARDVDKALSADLAFKEYRRRKTGGEVTKFVYGTRYEATVTAVSPDGKVVNSIHRELSGDDVYTPVRVNTEDLAPVAAPRPAASDPNAILPVGPQPADRTPLVDDTEAANRPTAAEIDAVDAYLGGADGAGVVTGIDEGINGVYVWLNRVRHVAAEAGHFVRVADWTVDQHEVDLVLRKITERGDRNRLEDGLATGITPDFLEPHAAEALTRTGYVVPLESKDGWTRQLRVNLVLRDATYSHATEKPALEQYVEADNRVVADRHTAGKGETMLGAEALFTFGGKTGPPKEQDHGKTPQDDHHGDPSGESSEHEAADHDGQKVSSSTGNYVGFGGSLGAVGARGHELSQMAGGLELNMASYEGRSYTHNMDAFYVLTYERSKNGVLRSDRRITKIQRGAETSTPHTVLPDLGLPVPAADLKAPAAKTQELVPIHQDVSFAASHLERLDARQVLPAVRGHLQGMKVDLNDVTISRAVESLYRNAAVRANYHTVRTDGLYLLITLPAGAGSIRRVGIRLTATEEPLVYERPRPDVKITTGGQAFKQTKDGKTTEVGIKKSVHADGRGTAADGTRVTGVMQASWESKSKARTLEQSTDRDIRRATTSSAEAQEFRAGVRYKLEFFEAKDQVEALSLFGEAGSKVLSGVDMILDGQARRGVQALGGQAGRAATAMSDAITNSFLGTAWRKIFKERPGNTLTRNGRLRLLTPTHLTAPQGRTPMGLPRVVETPGASGRWIRTDLPAPATKAVNGSFTDNPPADLTAAIAFSKELAKADGIQALEAFNMNDFLTWLPASRLNGAERFSSPPTVPNYEDLSTPRVSLGIEFNRSNVRANAPNLLNGDYVVPGARGDRFTTQAVLRNGRWLSRGGFNSMSFPESATENEREHETSRGYHVMPFELEVGGPFGPDRATGGAGREAGGDQDTKFHNSAGDYVEHNMFRKGDYDYYWFDVTLLGEENNKRSYVRSDVPYGIIVMLPAANTERYLRDFPGMMEAPRPDEATGRLTQTGFRTDIAHHAQLYAAAQDDAAVRDLSRRTPQQRRADLTRFLTTPVTAPNLSRDAQRAAALARLTGWTRDVELRGDPQTVPPEDCVIRAYGAFIAVHRRTSNGNASTDLLAQPTVATLLERLGGRLTKLNDPQALWNTMTARAGTMALVKTPSRVAGGPSHIFWLMSAGGGQMRWVDSQQQGLLTGAPADLSRARTMQPSTQGTPAAQNRAPTHEELFTGPDTEVMLLDETGRAVADLASLLPAGAVGRGQPLADLPPTQNRAGRITSASPWHGAEQQLRDALAQGGKAPTAPPANAPTAPPAQVVPVEAVPVEAVPAEAVPAEAVPAQTVPDMAPRLLGAWSGKLASHAADVRRFGQSAGRPVVAADLSGTAKQYGPVIDELNQVLTGFARMKISPIVVTTNATATGFDAIRDRHGPVIIQFTTAGWDPVWLLQSVDGEGRRMETRLNASLLADAGKLPGRAPEADGGVHLPGTVGAWTMSETWATAADFHRTHLTELHAPASGAALNRLIDSGRGNPRLEAFRTALDVTRAAGALPEPGAERLRPTVTSILDIEDRPAVEPRDPAVAGFVYDYLSTTGTRAERFAMDGLLFALMMNGALTHDQGLTLVRATAVNPTDRANVTVFEQIVELLRLPASALDADPMAEGTPQRAIMEKLGGVASAYRRPSDAPKEVRNPNCVDPIDRTAWIGRLDTLRDDLRATNPRLATSIEVATHILTNC
ncbi:putative nucleic acid-binding Zn-ribbon protein [Catenuloplanes nepalensis]|uniref:Nucleic acid-binding Zn-ribbon protein n=1 Tax=Catenuloplanes nepalensis TaxID=587533 RepID=A0ABT9MXI7_9ACTN|nr:hypothetical protein [Catenuloplanes nepalensis]MDP9796152.1 putative nucleic acid-binding Zn-ribbon protein [Catenuloplanes nepalensis]